MVLTGGNLHPMRTRIHRSVVFVFLLGVMLGGCSFFSKAYQNTIAYFNTYYNAQKAFDDAVRELEKSQPTTLQTNLFLPANVQQPVRQKFQTVIEKCSKIIQFYSETNLVDDAILLIGKSYYHLNEVVPAQKKFSEILDNFPSSDLRLEAKLMQAKTYYLADKPDDALNLLKSLLTESTEQGERNIAIEALMLEGQIYLDRNDYALAEQSYARALETSGDGRLLAYAAYLLGTCHEARGNNEAAAIAFLSVRDYKPPFPLEFHARLRAAGMFSMMGNAARSLEILEELQSEPLNPEQRSLVELEIAHTYERAGDYQLALSRYAVIDTLYKHTDASAKSNYYAATIHETRFFDLQQAKILYDKAKSEFPQSEVTPLAAKKAEVLGRYISYRNEFNKYDSLLSRFLHPEEEKSVDSLSRRTSVDEDSSGSTDVTMRDSLATGKTVDSVKTATIPIDTIHYRRSINQLALGILFLIDLDNPDSSLTWLTMLLNDYPDSKLAPQGLYVLSEVYRSFGNHQKVDSLYDVILTRYADSEYAANIRKRKEQLPLNAHRADTVEMLYARAMTMLEGGKTQQAIEILRHILSLDSAHDLNARARYALGWIYENVVMKNDSAIAQYRRLAQQYPKSVFTARIQQKLAFIDNKESEETSRSPQKVDTTKNTLKRIDEEGVDPTLDELRKQEKMKKIEPESKKDDKP